MLLAVLASPSNISEPCSAIEHIIGDAGRASDIIANIRTLTRHDQRQDRPITVAADD
jgi:hypothetical protein